MITDVEKEIAKSKKRCEDIDNSIFKLFEQNLTQRIPAESYKILLERYKRERAALDSQLITLERRRKSERARNKESVAAPRVEESEDLRPSSTTMQFESAEDSDL